jgi:excisionase family DNA binding protein
MTEQTVQAADLFTVTECAVMWRVSKMTVYRLLSEGEIPSIRIGRSLRIPGQAARDYSKPTTP